MTARIRWPAVVRSLLASLILGYALVAVFSGSIYVMGSVGGQWLHGADRWPPLIAYAFTGIGLLFIRA